MSEVLHFKDPAYIERIRSKRDRIVATLTGLENGTLFVVYEKGHTTAREVAERLGISPAAANNRLDALVKAGVLLREREVVGPPKGGHFYRYLNPPSLPPAGTEGTT
jgi:DNA-binding Lrp family transcriptional regulator